MNANDVTDINAAAAFDLAIQRAAEHLRGLTHQQRTKRAIRLALAYYGIPGIYVSEGDRPEPLCAFYVRASKKPR